VIKVFITYKSYLRLCHRCMYVYVLVGCSTVVVIVAMRGNCMLGCFLRIWVCWFLTFLLPCEGYSRSGYHSQVIYTCTWRSLWCCYYYDITVPSLSDLFLCRLFHYIYMLGRVIAETVSRWLHTAAARVRARVWQVGFVVDKVA
jgi:hypothetical protein